MLSVKRCREAERSGEDREDEALPLTFYSGTYGDRFSAVATQDFVLIHYDFDGDGELETEFGFRRVD